jgi:hypothetical protein
VFTAGVFEKLTLRSARSGMIEAELHLDTLCGGFRFPANFLVRRLKSTEAAHFVHDAFGIKLVLQALQRAINGFSFADNNFWHENLSFPGSVNNPTSTNHFSDADN